MKRTPGTSRPRRFWRRPLTVATAASLALFVLAAAVWVRSYWAVDSLGFIRRFGDPDSPGHGYTSFSVSWSVGTISAGGGTTLDRLPPDDRRVTWNSFPVAQLAHPPSPWLRFRSLYSSTPERPRGWSRGTIVWYWRVTVPCWAAALGAGVPPAFAARRWWSARRADRRVRLGRCGRCGYDLRATAGRCPECGAVSSGDGASN